MTHQDFIGTWKLTFAEYRFENGETIAIYGKNPAGMLIYDANGHVAIQIMRRDRPRFALNDRLGGTPDETKAAFDGYLAYFGTYTVDEEKHAVTHHLEGALLPNWISSDQTRFYELVDNRLTLKTPPLMIGGRQAVGHLIWERTP